MSVGKRFIPAGCWIASTAQQRPCRTVYRCSAKGAGGGFPLQLRRFVLDSVKQKPPVEVMLLGRYSSTFPKKLLRYQVHEEENVLSFTGEGGLIARECLC